jgi:hypothetical protein
MIIVACLVSNALFNLGGGQMMFAGSIQGAMTVLNEPAVISNKTAAPIMSSKTTSQSQESHADGPDNDNADADDDQFMNPSPVCQKLASASAMSLWVKNIDHILAAGKQPGDTNFNLQDVTAEVLKLITPRLPLSPRSFTRDWEKVEHLLNKVYARYRYIQYIQDDTKKEKEGHNDPPLLPL